VATHDRSSHGARTLPGEYYTSQGVYDTETERIFGRSWICVGVATSIPEAGDYFLAEVEGESVIVVRDRDGGVRAFYNVCRHRGTRLCSDENGCFSKYIVCPYHSWAYDLSGDLVTAPNMDDVEGFDPATLPLHALATTVWEGLVFVNLDCDATPFDVAYPSLTGRFTRWGLPELEPVHRIVYEVEANWKLLFQNYSECYHCPTLHPALNKLTPYRGTSNDLDEGPLLGGPMKLADGVSSMTTSGRACAAPFPGLEDEDLQLAYYYTLFPSVFLSLLPDYVLIHRLVRRGPTRTTVVCDWLFDAGAETKTPEVDPSGAIEFWDLTNKQDWGIVEQSQAGFASRAYVPGPYSNLESLLAAFDREYLRVMNGP
jgi:Rieske 2Fe-2S family protein